YMRKPNAAFNLANFMRANLYTAFGAMKIGCDILLKDEKVKLDRVTGHGGIFKTKGVAQSFMAAALETSVTVLDNAGEGGAWGIALLAAYMDDKKEGESLGDYLDQRIFADAEGTTMDCDPADVEGFAAFMEGYKAGLAVEKAAVENY
ncbi:MAG: ATPase, partial [Lachnospiraceae bacterium]|nr:ATPase [Candidatus Equihabitans merdae]